VSSPASILSSWECPSGLCRRPSIRTPRQQLLIAFVAGLVAASTVSAFAAPILGGAWAPSWSESAGAATRGAAADDAFPARELPREWRWSPPSVDVEPMFRRLGRPAHAGHASDGARRSAAQRAPTPRT
jgi:hypothetical protein